MKKIKSAPANLALMINNKKSNNHNFMIEKNEKKKTSYILLNIRYLNNNTERITNIINDILNDILTLTFEETAFLGIFLNLLNNIFRKDKLKNLSAILIQNSIKYLIMIYIHQYLLDDYINKNSMLGLIDFLH